MSEIFSNVPVIKYEGPDSKNPFAFSYPLCLASAGHFLLYWIMLFDII